ncbi:UDP-N-acetylglucosamine 2-epimerase [Brevundimonas sp.]|uniref:UDP-N-acetylglucosamine 2-epimerase n=1 Tax=Brevundimonas sp. TaxID=1871086 RepID=UPI002737CE7C|nr:UDP-N-acetylglucosamine 2-epimerase [Brevundimonas sp.]MDP3803011.1 UDP-N-acetylglucosamine 2-epimerase [Brevundimonas sp.]
MTDPRRVCVVTGGRADYGLLQWVMRDIAAEPALALQLIVTGAHLEPRFGETVKVIEGDGFRIDARVPLDLTDDTPAGVGRSMALALSGVGEAVERLQPDLLLVLGDRYEILAAAMAALLHALPVVHIAGGDITRGAVDDAARHALTKLSHVHLATHEQAADRIRQMGEEPWRVHVVGSPGLDHLRRTPLLDRAALETALGRPLGGRNLLVTFHPVTLAAEGGLTQVRALIAALDETAGDATVWITGVNADAGREAIAAALADWARRRPNTHLSDSLGQMRYLSLMKIADAVIGNSSSGLYEAPSLGTPTVDVGDRQAGRPAAASVIHAEPSAAAIAEAIRQALAAPRGSGETPYGDGRSAGRIVEVLKGLPDRPTLLAKQFVEAAS